MDGTEIVVSPIHARNVERYPDQIKGECDIWRTDWPYECDAKDRNPDHRVFKCVTHGVWWHVK